MAPAIHGCWLWAVYTLLVLNVSLHGGHYKGCVGSTTHIHTHTHTHTHIHTHTHTHTHTHKWLLLQVVGSNLNK